jgi:hypothetical protein
VTLSDLAKTFAADMALALGEGIASLIESGELDEAYARALEKLSDARLARKRFPDGRYVPP